MEEKCDQFSIPQSTIDWLLSSQTPSIRYFTYKNLLGLPDDDAMVSSTRAQIVDAKYTKDIITEQDSRGFWYNPKHYYGPKYRSSHWAMLLLTELGVPPTLDTLQRGADFMLERMKDDQHTYYSLASYHQNHDQSGFCCYWGNWLRYQIYCGRLSNPFVQQAIGIVSKDLGKKGQCAYNKHKPCAWGVIRSLFGLAIIPVDARTDNVRRAIEQGIAFVLNAYHLVEADYPNPGKIHPIWFKLSFPLYYQTDILFTLRVLAELHVLDHPGASKALK